MTKYVERLPLKSPGEMATSTSVSFDEILDVLEALGDALDFDTNAHLQEAYEASLVANVLPAGDDAQQLSGAAAAVLPRQRRSKSPTPRSAWTTSMAGCRTRLPTAANCGCARSDPGCCTSRPATAAWSPR